MFDQHGDQRRQHHHAHRTIDGANDAPTLTAATRTGNDSWQDTAGDDNFANREGDLDHTNAGLNTRTDTADATSATSWAATADGTSDIEQQPHRF